MATGASNADVAIVLVDARKGLLTQTHRHSIIVSLLGVRHVVLAVNKIDLVDYDERSSATSSSPIENSPNRSASARCSPSRSRRALATMSRRSARRRRGIRAGISCSISRPSRSRTTAAARPSACLCNGSTGRISISAASPARFRAAGSRAASRSSSPDRASRRPSSPSSSPTRRRRAPKRATR